MPFVLVNIFIKSYMTFFYGIHPPKDYILNDIEIKINKQNKTFVSFFIIICVPQILKNSLKAWNNMRESKLWHYSF